MDPSTLQSSKVNLRTEWDMGLVRDERVRQGNVVASRCWLVEVLSIYEGRVGLREVSRLMMINNHTKRGKAFLYVLPVMVIRVIYVCK
jgi:hypothetical protein